MSESNDYIYAGSKAREIRENLQLLADHGKRPKVDELSVIIEEAMKTRKLGKYAEAEGAA